MTDSDELYKLGELHQRGVLSDDEFARAKARVLGVGWQERREAPVTAAINAFRRSRSDRWFGGVCGGIAEATGIASWIWRLVFGLLFVCGGVGLVVYLLLWLLAPLQGEPVGSMAGT